MTKEKKIKQKDVEIENIVPKPINENNIQFSNPNPLKLDIGASLVLPNVKSFVPSIPQFFFSLREDLKDQKQFLPTRAHNNDTGWDVRFASEDGKPITIKPFEYVKLPLGIRTKMPDGWWLELKPRSSSFIKKHLHFLYGTIDCGFENQLMACFQYIPNGFQLNINTEESFSHYGDSLGYNSEAYLQADNLVIEYGEAIAQIIPVKLQQMEIKEVSNEEIDMMFKERAGSRGTNGFGSSDLQAGNGFIKFGQNE